MFQIFSGSEAHLYADKMDGIFRLRHSVFSERMRWKVRSKGDRERDRYDNLNPVYFALSDETGTVTGTWRLLPTEGPNMLKDVFPFLLGDRAVPSSPVIWEMSRLALDTSRNSKRTIGDQRSDVALMFCAALEYCSANGIRGLVVVHDQRMARITKRTLGYQPNWETESKNISGVGTSAAQYRIDSPAAFCKRRGIQGPILDIDQVQRIKRVA
ncbi:MAG: acyl-homoserine-lactone synthase [Alphaproteobacteria bacterium]